MIVWKNEPCRDGTCCDGKTLTVLATSVDATDAQESNATRLHNTLQRILKNMATKRHDHKPSLRLLIRHSYRIKSSGRAKKVNATHKLLNHEMRISISAIDYFTGVSANAFM